MADGLLKAFWGSVRLYIADLDGDLGRSLVVHEPSTGNAFTLQDRGEKPDRTNAVVVFCTVPTETDHWKKRYDAFKALRDKGEAQLFVHPLHGSYIAKIGECRLMMSSETDGVTLSVEFIRDGDVVAVSDVGAGITPAAGPEAVSMAATDVDASLAELGLSSTVPAEAVVASEAWAEAEEPDSRTVFAELGSLVAKVEDEVVRLELLTDLDRWPAYRDMVILRAHLVDAAAAVASFSQQIAEYVVLRSIPARVLGAQIAGARYAEAFAKEFVLLNDLASPGLVPPGTYKVPVLTGGAR